MLLFSEILHGYALLKGLVFILSQNAPLVYEEFADFFFFARNG